MNNKLFLIVQTNTYVGNYDRELMAYVFGYDADGYDAEGLDIFEKEMGKENKDIFYDYLDTTAFGEHDGEYSPFKIESHPTNKDYNCDSFYICLKKQFPKELSKAVAERLNGFCDYYNKKWNKDIKITDINYYKNKFIKVDEFNKDYQQSNDDRINYRAEVDKKADKLEFKFIQYLNSKKFKKAQKESIKEDEL